MWPFRIEHPGILAGLGIASVVMFVGSLIAVPWLLTRMPADYFIRERPQHLDDHGQWWWLGRKVFKNLAGGILVLVGVAMLVLPGQGLLTILIGLSLLDFPGKRKLELKLVRERHLLRLINWMRRKADKPELIVERNVESKPED